MSKKNQVRKVIYVIILTIVLFLVSSAASQIIYGVGLVGSTSTGWPLTYKTEIVLPNNPVIYNNNNLIIDILLWLLVSALIVYIPQTIAYFRKK